MSIDTSWVRFRLDFKNVNKIMKILLENLEVKLTKRDIAEKANLPIPKTESYLYWGRYLGLVNPSGYELTDFGKLYKELWKFDRKTILEILYYKCVRNNKLINILVNDYFKIKYSSYPYKFNIVDIDNFFKDKIKLLNFGNLDNFKEARSFFINSLSEEEGFGRLNLIKKISRQEYEIAKCLPTWKSTFYILGLNELSLKQQNASLIINIDRLLDEKNSLGRIFLLHEEDIDFLLDELVSMNLIKREKVSNFNQIKISENFNSESELIGVLHKYE